MPRVVLTRRLRRALRAPCLLLAGVVLACSGDARPPTGNTADDAADETDGRPGAGNPDWTEATHGRSAAPAYATVFPQQAVNTIEIRMTADQWSDVRADMQRLWGFDFGAGGVGGVFPRTNPRYIDVTVRFGGRTWTHVGFRLKGNSSLATAWRAGNHKLPFRLDFDRFEDTYRHIANQRFHGFKELSMSPAYRDPSLIREKTAADIFRLAGVPAAQTAFYRVFIDFGAGTRYVGVYTMVEIIEDTMIASQFGEDDGNVYKPESRLRVFRPGEFEKKNHERAADWRDVEAFIAALNDPLRITDAARWRSALEATFDVDHFLRYLAVNNVLVNWDVYGVMPQNYYLYHRPGKGLTWIPWDMNESLRGDPGLTGDTTGLLPGVDGLSLTMNEVDGELWPLIRFLADDPVYFARYREHVKTFATGVFSPAAMTALLSRHHALVAPYAIGAQGEQPGATYLTDASSFTSALPALQAHVIARHALAMTFVP